VCLANQFLQAEERAVQEATMLAKQLDEAHHELAKTKQVANEAQLRAESCSQEINIIKVLKSTLPGST